MGWILSSIFGSLLIVASFPPWDLSVLIFVALVPYLVMLERVEKLKTKLWLSFMIGFLMTVGGLYWVTYSVHSYGELPLPLAALVMLFFATFNQAQFILFAWIHHFLTNKWREKIPSPVAKTFFLALVYTGIDAVFPRFFLDTMGHALYNVPLLNQIADLGGAYLLTFFILFINLSLSNFVLHLLVRKTKKTPQQIKSCLPCLLLCVVLTLANLIYSKKKISALSHWDQQKNQSATVSLIQANIGNILKVASERGGDAGPYVVNKYLSLSRQARDQQGADIVIWPETAYPGTFAKPIMRYEIFLRNLVDEFIQESQSTVLITGGYDYKKGIDYNSIFFYSPYEQTAYKESPNIEIYRKHIPIPFAEYIPFIPKNKFLAGLFPQMGFFGKGIGARVIETQLPGDRLVKLAPVICYEALFSEYNIKAVNNGAEAILNVTNDSWFGPWGEPYLHLALTTFRSIETRTPHIRSTNTGISAFISSTGEIVKQSKMGKVEILTHKILLGPSAPTLIKLWGNWFGKFAFLLGLMGCLYILYPRKKRWPRCQKTL